MFGFAVMLIMLFVDIAYFICAVYFRFRGIKLDSFQTLALFMSLIVFHVVLIVAYRFL